MDKDMAGLFQVLYGKGDGTFRKAEVLKGTDGEPLIIPADNDQQLTEKICTRPFAVDWDGDGHLDLVSGCSDGGVYWARNKAGKGKMPDLEPFRPLIKPAKPVQHGQPLRESELTGPTYATRVWVADVNGDGKLDLIVGDCVTLVSPAKGVSEEEFTKRYAEWEKTFQAALAALNSAKDAKAREKATQEYQKVYGQRSEFMHEEMTGFVWVYL